MVAHFLRRPGFTQVPALDWLLVLAGALLAWWFWPPIHS
ncbi:MAG: hypothetical protein H6P99_1349 [Holophagaceae bacterium]|nr:hypothetical protein [Holophagaceae bacterium]